MTGKQEMEKSIFNTELKKITISSAHSSPLFTQPSKRGGDRDIEKITFVAFRQKCNPQSPTVYP